MEKYDIDSIGHCYKCDSLIQKMDKIDNGYISFRFKVDSLKSDSANLYIPSEFMHDLRVSYAYNREDSVHFVTGVSCNSNDDKLRLSYLIFEYKNEPYFPITGMWGMEIIKNVYSFDNNQIYISETINDDCILYKYYFHMMEESGYFRLTLINAKKFRVIEVILQNDIRRMKINQILATVLYSIRDVSEYTSY
ncbi:MAG: hypothetical protein IPI50_16300 [Saprospiraceae bacterium]|nr:hypothetical protein [Saprospiraceae bacterium]